MPLQSKRHRGMLCNVLFEVPFGVKFVVMCSQPCSSHPALTLHMSIITWSHCVHVHILVFMYPFHDGLTLAVWERHRHVPKSKAVKRWNKQNLFAATAFWCIAFVWHLRDVAVGFLVLVSYVSCLVVSHKYDSKAWLSLGLSRRSLGAWGSNFLYVRNCGLLMV